MLRDSIGSGLLVLVLPQARYDVKRDAVAGWHT